MYSERQDQVLQHQLREEEGPLPPREGEVRLLIGTIGNQIAFSASVQVHMTLLPYIADSEDSKWVQDML